MDEHIGSGLLSSAETHFDGQFELHGH